MATQEERYRPAPPNDSARPWLTGKTPLARGTVPYYTPATLMIDNGSGKAGGLAFVDESHGATDWFDMLAEMMGCEECATENRYLSTQVPPTWMDPVVFVRMAYKDESVRARLKEYVNGKNPGKRSNLRADLERIFAEQYIPYVQKQFAERSDYLTQWLIFAVKRESEDA